MKLTIVMPAYNESAALPEVIRRVLSVRLPVDREVIIVDDGSTDETPRILAALGARGDRRFRILRHERNRGKGAAIRTGIAASTGDFLVIQDADLQLDPIWLPHLLPPLVSGEADVVFGSRFLRGAVPGERFSHYFFNRLLALFASALFGVRVSDVETGFKAFRGDLIRGLPLVSERFDIEPELTAKVCLARVRYREVAVSYRPKRPNHDQPIGWRDGVTAIATLLRLRFASGRGGRPVRSMPRRSRPALPG